MAPHRRRPRRRTPPSLQAFKKAIRAKYDMKQKAFAAGDAKTIVTRFYAEDAQSVGEGYGIFHGRKDLWPLYTQAVKELNVKVTSMHTVVSGTAGLGLGELRCDCQRSEGKAVLFGDLVSLAKGQRRMDLQGRFLCARQPDYGKTRVPADVVARRPSMAGMRIKPIPTPPLTRRIIASFYAGMCRSGYPLLGS